MESLLERGEKLDDLVSKSEVLGTQSKAFYKTVSSCCLVLRAPFPHSHCSLFLLALSTRNRSFLVYITKVGFFAHLFILCFFDCWFFVFSWYWGLKWASYLPSPLEEFGFHSLGNGSLRQVPQTMVIWDRFTWTLFAVLWCDVFGAQTPSPHWFQFWSLGSALMPLFAE
jgi:hypothetical protein